jgi:predicted ArsR family transcriptional regulator
MSPMIYELRRPAAQGDLFNAPVPARQTDTSKAAAASLDRAAPRLRKLVLQAIRAAGAGGLTADEVAQRLKLSPLTARPRVCELNKLGEIRDSGIRRENRSGRTAIVWVAP